MAGTKLTSGCWLLLVVSVGAVACTGSDGRADGSEQPPAPAPAAVDFAAPDGDALARGVRPGDQTDQSLSGVAASEDVVVAVGSDYSANVHLPLFLTSVDGGEHWTRTRPDGPIVDGESPDSVAFGNGTFVASGSGVDGRQAIWTSPDGDAWVRQDLDSAVFTSTDDVTGVAYEGDAFYLTGSADRPRGASLSGALLWTSRDGTSWRRSDLRDHGLGKLVGESAVEDIAVIGDDLVVAVSVSDRTAVDQPDRVEIWRSQSARRPFRRDPTSPYFVGGYRAYAGDLITANDELVLAASGDGLTESTWDGVLMTGGASPEFWTKVTPKALSTPDEDHPSVVLLLDNAYLAAANVSDTNEALVVAGPSLEDLRPVRDRTLGGRNEQVIADGVALGDVGILVGYSGATGSSEAAMWRYADGALSPVRLPDEATGGRPSAYVNDVLGTDDGFVAVGLAGQGPTVWTSDDFSTWDAHGLPGRSAQVTAADARSLSRLPAGGAVAVGVLIRPLGADAGVWVRVGSRRWRLIKDPAFRIGGRSEYGSLEPRAVAADDRAVVVAATAYVDGREEARPLVGSADGRSWSVGVGTRRVPLSENDGYVGRTPYPAFRAPENGSIEMNAVATAGRGFVIGGSRGEPGRGTRGVVWRSRDGVVWSDPSGLPMPPGFRSATLTGFATLGDSLVAMGEVRKGVADADAGWATWISRDDGRTWRLGDVVAGRRGQAFQLLPIPGGLLALGSVGPESDLDAAAWTTVDGRRWQQVELGIGRTSGPGRQTFVCGVVDGDRLRLVGSDTPPEGGGSYVAAVDLPVP